MKNLAFSNGKIFPNIQIQWRSEEFNIQYNNKTTHIENDRNGLTKEEHEI